MTWPPAKGAGWRVLSRRSTAARWRERLTAGCLAPLAAKRDWIQTLREERLGSHVAVQRGGGVARELAARFAAPAAARPSADVSMAISKSLVVAS